MKRRQFLQTAMLSAGAFMHLPALAKGPNVLGVQLFSIPKLLETDFRAAIQLLSQIGFREIELYGPYPFSTEAARTRWNSITPALGFSGSGYFGQAPDKLIAIFKEFKMNVPSAHTDFDTLKTGMAKLGEAGHKLGFKYVVLPAIPEDKRKTLDDYRRIADEFNAIGNDAKRNGLKFAYHNHGYGLASMDGKIPLQVILDNTDKDSVFLEMDIFWTVAGGADPLALMNANPGRYHLMHVKDMKEKKRFSGDGGNSAQWIELFPYMTTAGSGVLDLKAIIETGQRTGVKHFFVEQDMVADPAVALKKSFDYLKGL